MLEKKSKVKSVIAQTKGGREHEASYWVVLLSAPLSGFPDLSFKMGYVLPAAISFNNRNYSLPLFCLLQAN